MEKWKTRHQEKGKFLEKDEAEGGGTFWERCSKANTSCESIWKDLNETTDLKRIYLPIVWSDQAVSFGAGCSMYIHRLHTRRAEVCPRGRAAVEVGSPEASILPLCPPCSLLLMSIPHQFYLKTVKPPANPRKRNWTTRQCSPSPLFSLYHWFPKMNYMGLFSSTKDVFYEYNICGHFSFWDNLTCFRNLCCLYCIL